MGFKLKTAAAEIKKNIYEDDKLNAGALVFLWALLCLFIINRMNSLLWAIAAGAIYYLSMTVFCIIFFKGISKYLVFPKENKKIPVFIGYKIDTLFVYPILLVALTGVISNLLAAAGLVPTAVPQLKAAGNGFLMQLSRLSLLPLAAYGEEILNLLMVSFFYTNLKLSGNLRLACSIPAAAFAFGVLHVSGWGIPGAVSVGISHIPLFLTTLYTGNIWISFLAHLYSNIISMTKAWYGGSFVTATAVLTFIAAIWSARVQFRKD
jgi:hypothetical protein